MMYKYGDMLADLDATQIYLVTTNSFIRKDGALVMGRGAAKQLANMYPDVPFDIIDSINHMGEYNVSLLLEDGYTFGAFQVKYHWRDAADLGLIERSVAVLCDYARTDSGIIYNLNYPGIGNGKLSVSDVEPLLTALPDNVHIWRF